MITVELKKEITDSVRLTPPLFWKNPINHYKEHIGLLDDKTVVTVLFIGDWVCIKNGSPESFRAELASAHKQFDISNESEFFAAFDEAYEAMRLSPEIRKVKQLIPLQNGVQ